MNKHTIHLPFFKQFQSSFLWNLFGSAGSQIILIGYHNLFRMLYGSSVHGVVGCLLSWVYLGTIISNGGLDYSIAPFLQRIIAHKQAMRVFLKEILIPQLLIISIGALLFTSFSPVSINTLTWYCVLGLIVSENLRKTFKNLLQLQFITQAPAIIELLSVILSIGFIGGYYLFSQEVLVEHIFLFQLMVSAAQLLLYLYIAYDLYRSAQDTGTSTQYSFDLYKTRFFTWINQTAHQLFSGNFLVPLCGIKFGMEQASLLKLITSITSLIPLIMQRVFGVTSNAVLAHIKNYPLLNQKNTFHTLTLMLNQLLVFLSVFLFINGRKLLLFYSNPATPIAWSLLYWMLLIQLLESLFLLYEKWFILEEQVQYYVIFNITCFILLYATLDQLVSPTQMLVAIIIGRILTYLAITLFAFFKWGLIPSYKVYSPTIITSVALSLIAYALLP